jgi:Subtilase family
VKRGFCEVYLSIYLSIATLSSAWANEVGVSKAAAAGNIYLKPAPIVYLPDMPEHKIKKDIERARLEKLSAPEKDAQGRTKYIYQFDDKAVKDTKLNGKSAKRIDKKFEDFHDPKTKELVATFEEEQGIEALLIFSDPFHVFSVFADESKHAVLKKDKRIKQATPVQTLEFSGGIWSDIVTVNGSGQKVITPWGVRAIGSVDGTNGLPVWVMDSGVNFNPDINLYQSIALPGFNAEGCYEHANFVAGIIGAKNNGSGIYGVRPNVPISSVPISDTGSSQSTNLGCTFSNVSIPLDKYLAASKVIVQKTIESCRLSLASRRPIVVNMSFNASPFTNAANFEFIRQGIQLLISPSNLLMNSSGGIFKLENYYPGAVVIQAAGNQYTDACSYTTYSYSNDGYIRVGAHDNNGQAVKPLNGINGFTIKTAAPDVPWQLGEVGSNYGSCVDVWAPGKLIASTFTNGNPNYGSTPGRTEYGSGTSFAAPHIAGLASYLIQTDPSLTTPSRVEQAIRQRLRFNGAYDTWWTGINTASISGVN